MKEGDDFYVFDIKLKGSILGMPLKWEMKSKVVDTPKDNIRFHKDMSNLDLSDSNHLAIQYNDSLFVIINYDKQLRPKSIFYINSQIEGSSRVRFYKK